MSLLDKGIKVGSRVRMLSTTQYDEDDSNPRDCEGTVDIYNNHHASVQWDNGYHNGSYDDKDIGLAEPTIINSYSLF